MLSNIKTIILLTINKIYFVLIKYYSNLYLHANKIYLYSKFYFLNK